jgi:hypothetical protein
MQSAVAMKPIQQAAEPQMVAMNAPFEQMNALSETIARRTDGRDLEDWFQAEAELLHTAHLHLYESDDALARLCRGRTLDQR